MKENLDWSWHPSVQAAHRLKVFLFVLALGFFVVGMVAGVVIALAVA